MTDDFPTASLHETSFDEGLANGFLMLERDPTAALTQAEALIRQNPDPRAFRLAACACRKLGLLTDAEGAELSAIKASVGNAELRAAALADAEGRSDEALQIARSFLSAHPEDLLANTLAAEAMLKLWDLEGAEEILRAVLARAPSFLRATVGLAECLAKQARVREAIASLQAVLDRKPDNLIALTNIAHYRTEVGDLEAACKLHERLASIDGLRPARWINLAHDYRMLGRKQDAIAAFRQALRVDPQNGSAWWGLANYFPEAVNNDDRIAIGNALADPNVQNAAALHLAAGLLAERAGDREAAFLAIMAGKKLQVEEDPNDPARITAAIDGVLKILTPALYGARGKSGWPDPAPIFLVGMHRSGSTLVERILGRHPEIEATGELQVIPRLAEWSRFKAGNPDIHAETLRTMSDKQLAWVGQRYVEASLEHRRTSKPHFIDKNNVNWMQMGLILLTLPGARIIDVRRNALDCCWANFKMMFAQGFPVTNDLRHVARFYRDYVRLVEAMKQIAPDRIMSVRYEDVVGDIEGETRRMLNFLNLEYEPDCINFHLSDEPVATASSEQVRTPLNRKGIGSAEPYRQWLGPLIEELGPLAETPA
jgi:tetratricopeptide (TPR) repeat protein